MGVLAGAPVQAHNAVLTTTAFTGAGEHEFTVPSGVTSLPITAVGAAGAPLALGAGQPGRAHRIQCTFAVPEGTSTLWVYVGGVGFRRFQGGSGGFNGGGSGFGGGGGASDVRTLRSAEPGSLTSRLIVAGGGGGGGGGGNRPSGGNAGADGLPDPTGRAGGGKRGTATAGGAAGQNHTDPGNASTAGALGVGGKGGQADGDDAGGGGGGGLFGGGGGGGKISSGTGGGGGGGSSSTCGQATVTNASASVSIQYDVPPVTIDDRPDITVPGTNPAGAVVAYEPPAARDAAKNPLEVTCTPPSGSTFAFATTTPVTCTATDGVGTATSTFAVTVTNADLAIQRPADVSVVASSEQGAVVDYPTPTVTGGGPYATIACTPTSGSQFVLGPTDVSCTATDPDDAASPISTTFQVTVTRLVIDPRADITVPGTDPAGVVVTYTPPTARLDTKAVPVVCAPPSGSTFAFDATTTVTCTATSAGVSVASTFRVVVANADLAIEAGPDVTVRADASGAVVTYPLPIVTGAGPSVTVSCDPPSGSQFPLGKTTVTCTATDPEDAASPAVDRFTVTVAPEANPNPNPNPNPKPKAEPSPKRKPVTQPEQERGPDAAGQARAEDLRGQPCGPIAARPCGG